MKKFILLFFIPLFTACEPAAVRSGRDMYKAYFKQALKDPESFKVYNEQYKIDKEYDGKIYWTLDYGAKNEYGGMVRKSKDFITIHRSIHIDDRFYDYKDLH